LDRDPPGLNKKVSGTISELFPESFVTFVNLFEKFDNLRTFLEMFGNRVSLFPESSDRDPDFSGNVRPGRIIRIL
jgi:hypothetical protein